MALALGALVGVASEAIDYGADQIGSTHLVNGAVAVGGHVALAAGAAFLDARATAAMVACGVKSGIQRGRVALALKSAATAKDVKKPAALKPGDPGYVAPPAPAPAPAPALTAPAWSPYAVAHAMGAVSVDRPGLPPARSAQFGAHVTGRRTVNAR
jgi:hypothetical protein